MRFIRRYAAHPDDNDRVRLKKTLACAVAVFCCVCGTMWSALYTHVFGWGVIAALPAAFVFIVGGALFIGEKKRDWRPAAGATIACITWISALIQWTIGSIDGSGMVIMWSFLGAIGGLIFLDKGRAIGLLITFLVIVLVSAVEPALLGEAQHVPIPWPRIFLVMNVGCAAIIVFASSAYFVRTTARERQRADRLVEKMLPRSIAARLKDGEVTIADRHETVSVLFADIAGFTVYSSTVSPEQLVAELNGIFQRFDELAARYGVEKIKTIGDAYMVASGVPESRDDSAEALAQFAIEMQRTAKTMVRGDGATFSLRVGIATGAAVAGVIGADKRAFDLWGDTVNTASRMESHGEPGRIQVCPVTAGRLEGRFQLDPRGEIEVKGKGKMQTWFLGDASS